MILLNDFRRQWADTRADVLRAVEQVGGSGWYIMGEALAAFEIALASQWTAPFCIGVASGLDALEISLRALGCGPGSRVLTTPLSAFATTLAIAKTGAVPVFVDTDDHGLIDLDCCEEILARRPDIRFLLPVHLYGHALDLARLAHLRGRFQLAIIEDCAQSIAATHRGRATGTVGQLAATSFYPTKNLGALGDGGAILTADDQLRNRIRALRDYGQSAKYRHDVIGYNSRLDELHAAILHRAYLHRLPTWTARRREIAARYLEGMHHPAVRPIAPPPGSESCFHLFPVTVTPERKPDFIAHLKRHDIVTAEHYPILIPRQKAMQGILCEAADDYPNARRLAQSEVSLPIHPYLTEDEIECVVGAVNSFPA